MGPLLDGLVKLQSVENRLRAFKSKVTRCRRGVIFQENLLRQLQSGIVAKQEEIKLTRIQSDRLEVELKSKDEYIAKMRAALNLAKSNKEYAAILTELNTSKADNTKLETQILELMKNSDADKAECDEIQLQIDEQTQKVDTLRKDADGKVIEFEKEMVAIQLEWDTAAKKIPADVLVTFKRVADTYDGEAIAVVGQQDERSESYSCGGCFMRQPSEVANRLMTNDEIIRCTNCTRILVMDQ
jgi:predicted  nucleic acid-binding Zn-ribbon protein